MQTLNIKGIQFPILLIDGTPVIDTDVSLLRNDLLNLLNHMIGQRFFAGQYGVRFWNMIEQPNDPVTLVLVREFTIEAINRYEPRIKLLEVNSTVSNEKLFVELKYIILQQAIEDSFIFTI